MSNTRKVCVYKNCQQESGQTLFKFPVEHDRFKVWCINAGLSVRGDIDITRTRYLCEKHFSLNYISNQARRKMLVHTAVPEKWKENMDDAEKVPKFNIIGEPPNKKRKIREYTLSELSAKPKVIVKVEKVFPEKRSFVNKVSAVSPTAIVEEIVEEDESDDQITLHKQPNTETYKIEEISKQEPSTRIVSDPNRNQVYKEITIQSQMRGKKMQYIVVKPKPKLSTSPVKSIIPKPEVVDPALNVYIVEENADESSPSLDSTKVTPEEKSPAKSESLSSPQNVKPVESLENYSEFIFNSEKYVQMPKRVFEAEKEKLRKQSEKYRTLLCKLKNCLNRMDLDLEMT